MSFIQMILSKIFLRRNCPVFSFPSSFMVAEVIPLPLKFVVTNNLPVSKDNIQITVFFHLAVKGAFGKITILRESDHSTLRECMFQ